MDAAEAKFALEPEATPAPTPKPKRRPKTRQRHWHGWKGKKDERWMREQQPLGYRVGRRFRKHVRTASNPRGKIIRPDCCSRCPRKTGQLYNSGGHVEIQACHVDYRKPFLVLWLCQGCHRRLEQNTLTVRKRDLYDYSSLVCTKPHRWLDDVPF